MRTISILSLICISERLRRYLRHGIFCLNLSALRKKNKKQSIIARNWLERLGTPCGNESRAQLEKARENQTFSRASFNNPGGFLLSHETQRSEVRSCAGQCTRACYNFPPVTE